MAEQAEADDVHEEDFEDILDQGGDADDQDDNEGQAPDDNAADEDDEEVVVQFGDEAAPASEGKSESDQFRELRAAHRQQAKELAALRAQARQPQPEVVEVGERPTLASVDYDEDKLVAETEAWIERKRKADEVNTQVQQRAEAQKAEFAKDLERFETGKSALKVRDFEDAKDAVIAVLSQDQISAIVQASKRSAEFIYGLGKNPKQLETLAAIKNPVKFIAAIGELGVSLKVKTTSRKAPELDTPVRGSAPLSASTDKQLERLRADAAKTGDVTKVVAYKREQAAKARK